MGQIIKHKQHNKKSDPKTTTTKTKTHQNNKERKANMQKTQIIK